MLSECHNTNHISYWLTEWMTECKTPFCVISDHSLALLGAIARSIAKEASLSDYINKSFQIITISQLSHQKPELGTYIRVDYAHLMKFVSRWDCFKNKPPQFKRFYLKLVARLVKCRNFSDANRIISNIFIVSNSFYEGSDSNNSPLKSEIAKIYLKNLIADINVDLAYEEEKIESNDCETNNTDCKLVETWIRDIFNGAKESFIDNVIEPESSSVRENFHYSLEFSNSFRKLLKTYTLWSAILTHHFGVCEATASSAPVESYFNDLKNRTFHGCLPLNADKFVLRHIKEIESMIVLANERSERPSAEHSDTQTAELYNKNTDAEKNVYETNIVSITAESPPNEDDSYALSADSCQGAEIDEEDVEEALIVENWKGLGNPKKKKTRSSFYAAPCPEILVLEDHRRMELPLIKNGNIVNKTTTTKVSDGVSILLGNTCPFDTILQCILSAYCDSIGFQQKINENKEDVKIFNLLSTVATKGAGSQFRKERAVFLNEIYKQQKLAINSKILRVDCQDNVISALQKTGQGLNSLTEIHKCMKCSYEKRISRIYKTIQITDYSNENFESTFLRSLQGQFKCQMCSNKVIVETIFSTHLFIDTSEAENINIEKLPVTLKCGGQQLILRGLVAYQKSLTRQSLGHYISICRRNDGALELYDDMAKKVKIVEKTLELNIHLLLYSI